MPSIQVNFVIYFFIVVYLCLFVEVLLTESIPWKNTVIAQKHKQAKNSLKINTS